MVKVLVVGIAMLASRSAAQRERSETQKPARQILWAAITIPQPMYAEGGTANLQIYFGVVNDGSSTVNPKIGASHLSVNGVEPKDWLFIINNGLRTPESEALPPAHSLSFGYQLGRYFATPGVYTVRWWGENFRAQPITFRVLLGKTNAARASAR